MTADPVEAALLLAQDAVDDAAAAVTAARGRRLAAVAQARAAGWSHGRIATTLGISRAAAQQLAAETDTPTPTIAQPTDNNLD